MRLFIKI